jgi:hypothetical protein
MASKSASSKIDRMSTHNLVTNAHAASAQNAVLMIADKERIIILIKRLGYFELMAGFTDTKFIGVLLKKTHATLITGYTIQWVFGNEKVYDLPAGLLQFCVLGFDRHTIRAGQTAAGSRIRISLNIDNAQAAATRYTQLRVIAQMGNVDIIRQGGFQYSCSRLCQDFLSINGQFNQFFSPFNILVAGKAQLTPVSMACVG